MRDTWTLDTYVTYLYCMVADADFETSDKEMEMVKDKLSRLFSVHFSGQDYDFHKQFQIIQETPHVSWIHSKEVVNDLSLKYPLEKTVRMDLFADFESIVASDEKVTPSEHEVVSHLKRTLMATEMPLSW